MKNMSIKLIRNANISIKNNQLVWMSCVRLLEKLFFFSFDTIHHVFFSYVTSTIHQKLKTKKLNGVEKKNIHETVTSKWNGIHCLFFRPTECRRQCGILCFNLIRWSYSLNIWFYCHTIWLNWGCFDGRVGFFLSLSLSLAFSLNI